jgi:hypothetical protein
VMFWLLLGVRKKLDPDIIESDLKPKNRRLVFLFPFFRGYNFCFSQGLVWFFNLLVWILPFVVETLGFGLFTLCCWKPKRVNLGLPRPNPKSALKWQLFLVLHGMIQASILGHRQNRICELLQSCNNPWLLDDKIRGKQSSSNLVTILDCLMTKSGVSNQVAIL